VRKGEPTLLIIDTERLGPHSKGDDLRDADEMRRIRRRDPLAALGRTLNDQERNAIETEVAAVIANAHTRALASPPAEQLTTERTILRPAKWKTPSLHTPVEGNVRRQLNSALRELLQNDSRVILLGEDLHDPYGGAFKVTAGLSTEFPGRLISTPISEAAIAGTGIGLAMSGFRPVLEVMFADFLTLCMDQLFNHAVKFPGMFPNTEVPLVIRTPSGGGRGYGPTHSQCPENLLAAIPGLTVICPTHRHPVGRMLESAVLRWPNPSIFFEHKLLYGETASAGSFIALKADDNDPGTELFPTMVLPCETPDLTIVTYGGMLPLIERVKHDLLDEEILIEIVAPALLNPLPRHQLGSLLRPRPAVLVVEEAYAEAGFGSAVGSLLLEQGFRGRFAHVHPPPVPIPAARSLETRILPGYSHVLQRALELLRA
jgi:2-oxoisovalerate dehydrogenase E1 component